ncbi:MAG TPA: ribosome maturation factor RimM [Candidatus Limosilactobacillus merdipullorum]|uniref:Ribosome maturation factor RimM n=1 Tax=Candidatus Limosilactobacillus merdipullorum TaxID=2838653 RepID=A0A9D1QN49_9LACO|nr:ribosome maturation factor RimM [Candidatus Limosilactobacillus merdipullorum]
MNYYDVATIVKTHGIKGELQVISLTDFPEERFQPGSQLFIEKDDGQHQEVEVESARPHKQFMLIKLKGYDNINDVLQFTKKKLQVSEDQQDDLPQGQYYYRQIVGLDVKTTNGQLLGQIKEIMPTGANDVWVVVRPNKEDLLLPAIPDVIKEVNLDDGLVIVELMEGLE